jgi:hypothetical protein
MARRPGTITQARSYSAHTGSAMQGKPPQPFKPITATIKNNTNSVRSFRDERNGIISIAPGQLQTFNMHPHQMRIIKKEAETGNPPRIEVIRSTETDTEIMPRPARTAHFLTDPAQTGMQQGAAGQMSGATPPNETQPPATPPGPERYNSIDGGEGGLGGSGGDAAPKQTTSEPVGRVRGRGKGNKAK